MQSGGSTLASRYGFSDAALAVAADRASEILVMLSARLHAQQETGSDYFVGDTFTAADLYNNVKLAGGDGRHDRIQSR